VYGAARDVPDEGDAVNQEIHELPLAGRLIDDLVCEFLDLATALAREAAPNDERRKAIREMRHLRLDGYSYQLTPKILDALTRAGLLLSPEQLAVVEAARAWRRHVGDYPMPASDFVRDMIAAVDALDAAP
jgi:hypothetical protein